jgi:hypothetical protein
MTTKTIGITTAAAMMNSKTINSVMKVHKGIPQHRRRFLVFSLLIAESVTPPRDSLRAEGHLDDWLLGVSCPGGGNAASMSESPDWRVSFLSGAPASQKSRPKRLAVFPRSRFAASRVALLINSGRLVRLPRASASRTASISSFGGLLVPARSAKLDVVLRVSSGKG